jgi:AraC family transcriptional regulator, activator of mtrCDE
VWAIFHCATHDRLIRSYLPANLVPRAIDGHLKDGIGSASNQLANLVSLMRVESGADRAGGRAILNALSSALFALVLRAASEAERAPEGLLALAGHPRWLQQLPRCSRIRRGLGNYLIWRTCAACRALRS